MNAFSKCNNSFKFTQKNYPSKIEAILSKFSNAFLYFSESWRCDESTMKNVNDVLKLYLGSHYFHNYTSGSYFNFWYIEIRNNRKRNALKSD